MEHQTVLQLLKWATHQLASREQAIQQQRGSAGTDSDVTADTEAEFMAKVRHDAETLLCATAGWSQLDMLIRFSERVPEDVYDRFTQALDERMKGKPIQYITGAAPFYGRLFRVRTGCLIPRPETEVLIDEAIAWVKRWNPRARVLDLGTGSGILATTMAMECPGTSVQAVDISEAAIEIAQENARAHGAPVAFHLLDGLQHLRDLATADESDESNQPSRIHLLLSNPPYIPTHDVLELDDEVRLYEPAIALDGGDDGLDYYRTIASIGDGFFADGPAAFFYEVGAGQAEDVVRLYHCACASLWPNWRFTIIPDLRGIGRVVHGERI